MRNPFNRVVAAAVISSLLLGAGAPGASATSVRQNRIDFADSMGSQALTLLLTSFFKGSDASPALTGYQLSRRWLLSMGLPGFLLVRQTAPKELPLPVVNRIIQHLEQVMDNPGTAAEAYSQFQTPVYWQKAVEVPLATAEQIADLIQLADGAIDRRMRAIDLVQLNPPLPLRLILLRHQIATAVVVQVMELSPAVEDRVRFIVTYLLPIMIDEQIEVARWVHDRRQTVPAAAPWEMMMKPQFDAALQLLSPGVLRSALEAWGRELPKSYARLLPSGPDSVTVNELFDPKFFVELNAPLAPYRYVMSMDVLPPLQTGIQRMSVRIYEFDPAEDRILSLAGRSVPVSRGTRLRALGGETLFGGDVSAFNVQGVTDRILVIPESIRRAATLIMDAKQTAAGETTKLFGVGDPAYRVLLDQTFPESSQVAIEEYLETDAILHELLNRWFDFQQFDRAGAPVTRLFSAQGTAVAQIFRKHFAASVGRLALGTRPLWNLVQMLLALPNPGQPGDPNAHLLNDRILRDLVEYLPEVARRNIQWPTEFSLLSRNQGLQLLRLVVTKQISIAQLQAAAQQSYERHVGMLMPTPGPIPSPARALLPIPVSLHETLNRNEWHHREDRNRRAYVKRITRLVEKEGHIYSGFEREDAEFFLQLSDHAEKFHEITDPPPQRTPTKWQYVLRKRNGGKKLEFVPLMDTRNVVAYIDSDDLRFGSKPPAELSKALMAALGGLQMSTHEFIKAMIANNIQMVTFTFPPELDAVEETLMYDGWAPATVEITRRALEIGFSDVLFMGILKGMINVITPVGPMEDFEVKTLSRFLPAAVSALGFEGLRSALQLVGPGAQPMLDLMDQLMHDATEHASHYRYKRNELGWGNEGRMLAIYLEKVIPPHALGSRIREMLEAVDNLYPEFRKVPYGSDAGKKRKLLPIALGRAS